MFTDAHLLNILREWETTVGNAPRITLQTPGRDLWFVVADDGTDYVLKRLGSWRNLPVADEARILTYLTSTGVSVAEFISTDGAMMHTEPIEDSFVLMPRIEDIKMSSSELLPLEASIGAAVAELHIQLANYPRPANSYVETVHESLQQELMLPVELAERLEARRGVMGEFPADLPQQLIHGDLTPENLILRQPPQGPAFIDFEHLPIGLRIWDVAKYCSRRIRQRWFEDRHPSDANRLDHVVEFLRGYHQSNQLNPAECAALPAAIAAANIVEVSYFREISVGMLQRRRLPDHDEVLADATEAAVWQMDNYECVRGAIQLAFR